MKTRLAMAALLVLAGAAAAAAQPAVVLVRHAERADGGSPPPSMMAADPDLSDAGRRRAESLARLLKDAKITAIVATEFRRTQQTAAPLARALGVPVTEISSKDPAALSARLAAATGNVLVVGHSNSVPDAIRALGVTEPVTIGESEYDNLFVVFRGAAPALLRLRY